MHTKRTALVVGIDHYETATKLFGCVNDAISVAKLLERNGDNSKNFDVELLTARTRDDAITKGRLKDRVERLFATDGDVKLFYFAGHGHLEASGGYLVTSECERGDDGVALTDVVGFANNGEAQDKVIILDSCNSGFAGNMSRYSKFAELSEGLTILTASTAEQYATEANGRGLFTSLLVDALGGAAANLLGEITPGAAYAHIDQSLNSLEQRPIFRTNVQNFVSLRKVAPPIKLEELHQITSLFPAVGYLFPLDPSFEPELAGRPAKAAKPKPENMAKFDVLQKFNRVNLVVPVGAPHMWHAAMESKACRLTALGEHYRRLVERNII